MATVAEWNAKTETLKGLIAEQKFKQVERQLKREQQRTDKLESIADQVLTTEIKRAEIGLAVKQSDMEGDRLALAASKDKVSYTRAKHQLQQQQWRIELMTMQHSLAASEEGLRQLKSVAATLNHKLGSGPKLAFSSSSSNTSNTTEG
jgi:exonuclease VII large subunit